MAITVIGHITHDTLIFPGPEWRIVEGLGGTLYTVSALASLTNKPIRLVCNVGEDVFEQAMDILRGFPNVDVSGVSIIQGKHLHCYILFVSKYGTQYDEGKEVPISFSQVKPFLCNSDFILVSPMTGFDLDLRTLKRIKKHSQAPIYLDYHILALDRDPLGNRFVRRRHDWFEWCTSCDHLQLNEFEAESLSSFPMNTEKAILNFARPILEKGVKSVAVTLGEKGALVCWKEQEMDVQVRRIDPISVQVEDATGAGDVFAAAFIVHFMKTGDLFGSYEFANATAALKCKFKSMSKFSEALRPG